MAKNKKKRKPHKKDEFKKPSKADYERGKIGIYAIVGVTAVVVIGLIYLYSVK